MKMEDEEKRTANQVSNKMQNDNAEKITTITRTTATATATPATDDRQTTQPTRREIDKNKDERHIAIELTKEMRRNIFITLSNAHSLSLISFFLSFVVESLAAVGMAIVMEGGVAACYYCWFLFFFFFFKLNENEHKFIFRVIFKHLDAIK